MIPVKHRLHGSRQACEALMGQARRVMLILENMMRLNGNKQQEIRFVPYDGAMIIARQFFGTRVIDIFAGSLPPPPLLAPEKVCLCNCNFSVGWILEEQVEMVNGSQLYTVAACNNKGKVYIPYTDVLASDFSPYEVGQRVIMIPYNTMAYLCCTDKTGGESQLRGCSPLVSEDSIDSESWRTAYRILPWCAVRVPKKMLKGKWNHNG